MKQYLSNNSRYFISMLAIGLLVLLAQWQTEIFESNAESIGFMRDWFDGELNLFFQNWSNFIAFIATLLAASIPAFVLFRSRSQVFARRYVNFIITWFVVEIFFVAFFELPEEFVNDSYAFVNAVEMVWDVLPFVVGYIMLCIWFGYSIANTAAKKGKSWDSFFWLTMLFGPLIMWFIVSLLSAEEEHAKGKVRGSATWAESRTKVLLASHGSVARIAVIVPATLITLDAILIFGYQNFIDPSSAQIINDIEGWSNLLILVEVLGFSYLMLNIKFSNTVPKMQEFWSYLRRNGKALSPRLVITTVVGAIVVVIALFALFAAVSDSISSMNRCSGGINAEACQVIEDAESFLGSLDADSPERDQVEVLLKSLKQWVDKKGTSEAVVDSVTVRLKEAIGQ